MSPIPTGWDAFLQAAGFGQPQTDIPEMPPIRQPALPNRMGPYMAMPNAYGDQASGPLFPEIGPEPPSILDMYQQSVLNPPRRTQMTYPKNTLAGLQKGLELLAEDSPTKKNRVFIDGKPHQRVQVFTDTEGKQRTIAPKDPSFADQVLRTLPAAMSPAVDILNQKRADEIADWEMKNKGMASAIDAESKLALAGQRYAQAGYTGQRAGLEQQRIDISRMTAEERVRASQLNTLTDAQKLQLLQQGRISLAELQAAEAMKRVEAQQAGATTRTGMQQAGATERVGMQQAAQDERTRRIIEAANERNRAAIEGRIKLKQTPGAPGSPGAANYPSQQKIALQNRTAQVISQHPEWEPYITFDENDFPRIEMPDTSWGYATSPEDVKMYNDMYQAIYGQQQAAPITPAAAPPPALPTTKPAAPTAKPVAKKAGPPEPTGPPPAGYVYVEDINGNFIGQLKIDENLKKLNTAKYRVRQ